MIKVGDVCIIKEVDDGTNHAVYESLGLKVRVTVMAHDLCWVRIMEGPWHGVEAPCLVSRLEKHEVMA